MKIFIDGDGCPVIDLTISMAKNYGLECIIICDTAHSIERDDAKTITVSKGRDSADFYLVNMLSKEDICVTQDYGLAAMCLSSGNKLKKSETLVISRVSGFSKNPLIRF